MEVYLRWSQVAHRAHNPIFINLWDDLLNGEFFDTLLFVRVLVERCGGNTTGSILIGGRSNR